MSPWGMYAEKARDLLVCAGFSGSLERREALVGLLSQNGLATANRIRFAGDPSSWNGAGDVDLSQEEVAFLFCLGQRGEKRPRGAQESAVSFLRFCWGCRGSCVFCVRAGQWCCAPRA